MGQSNNIMILPYKYCGPLLHSSDPDEPGPPYHEVIRVAPDPDEPGSLQIRESSKERSSRDSYVTRRCKKSG